MPSVPLRIAFGVIIMAADTASGDILLIQFAKSPAPGEVKTRMMPELTAHQACELHRDLLLWSCARLCESGLGPLELWVSGDRAQGNRAAAAKALGLHRTHLLKLIKSLNIE